MTLIERVSQELTAAMKARDERRTSALRMAKAALKNREIDKRQPLTEAEAEQVVRSLVKQREDSIVQFRQANRPELAEKEEAELVILRGFLPAEASEEDLLAAVEKAVAETGAASPRDLGKVMKAALAALQAAGKPADGRKVNELARRKLGG